MRTTIDLPPSLLRRLRAEAHERGVSFKHLLGQVVERGLEAQQATGNALPRLPSASLGQLRPGVDLDRALALAEALPGWSSSASCG